MCNSETCVEWVKAWRVDRNVPCDGQLKNNGAPWDQAGCHHWTEVINQICINRISNIKANLRGLIAAIGLVISNWIQIVNFSARVTLKFNGWPCKTVGHLFYTTSSFVHHFKSIGEFKLDLQSRNAQFGSKLVICYTVWPWNLMDDLGKQ